MRSYSAPVLIWFTCGQGRITIAGETRGFGAHNAIFLPPGTMHGFETTAQIFGSQVTFPRDFAGMLPDRPHHLRFRDATEQNELSQMIDNLQRELDRELPVADKALAHHGGLLSVWLERQILKRDPEDSPQTAAKRLVAAFTALVEEDVSAAHSVGDFAAKLGVTPTHLTRSCKAACGRSAHEILSDRVFYEARSLLRETDWPVKRIAETLGFTSPAYFTRAFQKATRETPTAFRRRR
nr:AraC family transcriptional regulator [Frigidibacter sp. ROC022]